MTLAATHAPWIRIANDAIDAEAYVTLDAYRNAWVDRGWLAPLDDPSFGTADIIDGGPAAAVSDIIDGGSAPVPAADTINGGSA